MRTNEIHKINCFVNWCISNAEHVKFLTIWRKWGKDILDFAMKWSCFSNYPWFCFYFTRPPITQNLDTLNTCVHWTLFHFPWVFNVDRFHCMYVCMYVSTYLSIYTYTYIYIRAALTTHELEWLEPWRKLAELELKCSNRELVDVENIHLTQGA